MAMQNPFTTTMSGGRLHCAQGPQLPLLELFRQIALYLAAAVFGLKGQRIRLLSAPRPRCRVQILIELSSVRMGAGFSPEIATVIFSDRTCIKDEPEDQALKLLRLAGREWRRVGPSGVEAHVWGIQSGSRISGS